VEKAKNGETLKNMKTKTPPLIPCDTPFPIPVEMPIEVHISPL